MHIDEEQVQRLLHGELAEPARTQVTRHVAACASCAARVDAARREERWLLGVLAEGDRPVPAADLAALVRRAGSRRGWYWQRRAAAVLLAVAAATAAYALPGSPLSSWVRHIGQWLGETPDKDPRDVVTTPNLTDSAVAAAAGIALLPGARLTIAFTATQPSGAAHVMLTDDAQVRVRARSGRVTYTTGDNYLTIDNAGSLADHIIEIPRQAPQVDVRLRDRLLITLQHGQRTAGVEVRQDARGEVRIPLRPADR